MLRVGTRWLLSILLVMAGCSLTRPTQSNCVSNSQCQVALGAEFLCVQSDCVSSFDTPCATDLQCANEVGPDYRCDSDLGVCAPASQTLCSASDICRGAFGIGGFCSPSGFCTQNEPPNRCELTFPLDLLDNPTAYADYFMIGAITIGDEDSRRVRARSVELAVRSVNEAEGIGSRVGLPGGGKVGLVACTSHQDDMFDALSSNEAAVQMGRYLSDEIGAQVIIGPQTSANTLSVFNDLAGRSLLISPSATSIELIAADNPTPSDANPGLLWRTPVGDDLQAPKLAEIIQTCGYLKVGIVYQDDAYGGGLHGLIKPLLEASDPPIEVVSFPYNSTPEQSDQQQAMASDEAIDIALFIDSDAENAINGFLDAMAVHPTWAGRPILLSDAGATPDAVQGVADGIVGAIRGTRPIPSPGPLFMDFQNTFSAFFSQIDPVATDAIANDNVAFVAQAYDATWMALYGTAWAMLREFEVQPRTIARGLRKLSDPDPLVVSIDVKGSTWAAAITTLQGGDPINIRGASGLLDFDDATEELRFGPEDDPIGVYRYESAGEQVYNIIPDTTETGVCPFAG